MTLSSMDVPLKDRTLSKVLRAKAQLNGDRTFIIFEGRRYSYAEVYDQSRQFACRLLAIGIQPQQHVAIMMESRPENIFLHFALAMIGAVAVPINTAARGDLLAYYVKQSDSVTLLIEETFTERFGLVIEQCEMLRTVVLFRTENSARPKDVFAKELGHTQLIAWHQFDDAALETELIDCKYNDILHILYSSGTTGTSKGSMVSNATALMAAAKYVELNGYNHTDVMYTCLPMFHGNAWNCTILPALIADAAVALSRRFSARNFWREIGEMEATHCSLLSAMINILWLQEPSPQEQAHSLRTCLVVPTPEFSEEFEKRYKVKISSLYSLSDFGLATVLSPSAPRNKLRSAGKPLPEMSVSILDEDDLPLPTGEVGEICLRNNDSWFGRQGYYKLPELYLAATRNLWFHTGDRGWLDTDGYLYFAGRSKDLIRRRGENISALQVEEIIMKHPAVADVAVYAVRAEFLEDEVMASIVCKPGIELDPKDLVEFCAPRIAYFMVPRFIEFLSELPVTPTNKVEKYKLRESAEKRLHEIWDRDRSGIVLEK